ncbi:hypothetical protein ACNKHX_23800 [Shigella flexneri]
MNHTLGSPRVGLRRELKKAQESYWAELLTREELLTVGRELRAVTGINKSKAGIDLLPVGDFAWYDYVLTTSLLLGNVLATSSEQDGSVDIDTRFVLVGGRARLAVTCGGSGNDQSVQHQLSRHGAGVR